jgi:hypothetical protein
MGDGNLGPRGGKVYLFHFPGCECGHPFELDAPDDAGWTWNGLCDRLTFTPSLLCNAQRSVAALPFLCDGWPDPVPFRLVAFSSRAEDGPSRLGLNQAPLRGLISD